MEYKGGEYREPQAIDVSSTSGYGNVRRQLDRQNEVIDQIAKVIFSLEDRLSAVLEDPRPRASGPEEDSPYMPQLPMMISKHNDRLDEIFHKLIEIGDRIDL